MWGIQMRCSSASGCRRPHPVADSSVKESGNWGMEILIRFRYNHSKKTWPRGCRGIDLVRPVFSGRMSHRRRPVPISGKGVPHDREQTTEKAAGSRASGLHRHRCPPGVRRTAVLPSPGCPGGRCPQPGRCGGGGVQIPHPQAAAIGLPDPVLPVCLPGRAHR